MAIKVVVVVKQSAGTSQMTLPTEDDLARWVVAACDAILDKTPYLSARRLGNAVIVAGPPAQQFEFTVLIELEERAALDALRKGLTPDYPFEAVVLDEITSHCYLSDGVELNVTLH